MTAITTSEQVTIGLATIIIAQAADFTKNTITTETIDMASMQVIILTIITIVIITITTIIISIQITGILITTITLETTDIIIITVIILTTKITMENIITKIAAQCTVIKIQDTISIVLIGTMNIEELILITSDRTMVTISNFGICPTTKTQLKTGLIIGIGTSIYRTEVTKGHIAEVRNLEEK